MKIELVITSDGSHTLYLPEMNEQYHSLNGAITESMHVYIENGFLQNKNQSSVIFEVGFGTGLNALLTSIHAKKTKKHTVYYSIEKFPLDEILVNQLNYGQIISEEAQQVFRNLHECKWNTTVRVNSYFEIHKLNDDLKSCILEDILPFDVVYYDAFGPEKQPEMWKPDIFRKIADHTNTGGIIVTYSAKGEVRRQMASAGFAMERLLGPPGKKQMLRGIKGGSFT